MSDLTFSAAAIGGFNHYTGADRNCCQTLLLYMIINLHPDAPPAVGTADAEFEPPPPPPPPPRLNPELSEVFPLTAGAGQNIATYASHTARNFFLVLISIFPVHSASFFSKSSPYLSTALALIANAVSRVGPTQNKIGRPAHSQKRVKQVPVVSTNQT